MGITIKTSMFTYKVTFKFTTKYFVTTIKTLQFEQLLNPLLKSYVNLTFQN